MISVSLPFGCGWVRTTIRPRAPGLPWGMPETFGWLEVDMIGEQLAIRHPDRDPMLIRFTELRRLVEALPGFKEEPGHPVNEKILETIQAHWIEEKQDLADDQDEDDDDD